MLPSDFFDNPEKPKQVKTEVTDQREGNEGETNKIPKGFFDNPELDAKARKEVFKNPADEEWEKFQKAVAEENVASLTILEQNAEELQKDKNLEEIEEQISMWSKVEELQKRADNLKPQVKVKLKREQTDSEGVDSSEEEDIEVFGNWRNKKISRLK